MWRVYECVGLQGGLEARAVTAGPFLNFFHHFGQFLTCFSGLCHRTRVVWHALFGVHDDRVLTRACNPMLGRFTSSGHVGGRPHQAAQGHSHVRVILTWA